MADKLLQIGTLGRSADGATVAADVPIEETLSPPAATGGVAEPVHEEPVAAGTVGMINIRNLSVKCGHCDCYQTLMTFTQNAEGWNVYTYECEGTHCVAEHSRTLIEIPQDLDEYAHRDPEWRGGAIHGGAE